jgi:hypothetical protein
MSKSNSPDQGRQSPRPCDSPVQPKNRASDSGSTDEGRLWGQRHMISIPVLATGYEPSGEQWREETETLDCSEAGLTLHLGRQVQIGMLLHLLLPLPDELRSYQQAGRNYSVYALVQRLDPPENGKRIVALEFIGEQPPPRYLGTPWATYRPNGKRAERRQESREQWAEDVTVEYFDDLMQPIKQTTGVTEDLSPSGAKVCVENVPRDFEWIRITCKGQSFESYAVVRDRFVDGDGDEYLCVEFVESKWVLRKFQGHSGPES